MPTVHISTKSIVNSIYFCRLTAGFRVHGHIHCIQYPSDTRHKAFCMANVFKCGAKRVYYKRKTRVHAVFCETNRDSTRRSRAKGMAHLRGVYVLEFCARRILYTCRY